MRYFLESSTYPTGVLHTVVKLGALIDSCSLIGVPGQQGPQLPLGDSSHFHAPQHGIPLCPDCTRVCVSCTVITAVLLRLLPPLPAGRLLHKALKLLSISTNLSNFYLVDRNPKLTLVSVEAVTEVSKSIQLRRSVEGNYPGILTDIIT